MRCESCQNELKPTGFTFKFSRTANQSYPDLINEKYYLTYHCLNKKCEDYGADFIRNEKGKLLKLHTGKKGNFDENH